PEAPTKATTSPAPTATLAPRNTRTSSGPTRYSFSMSSPSSRRSLIPQHVHRRQRAGATGRQDGRQEGQEQRRADDQHEVRRRELHRQMVDLVDVAGQPDDLVGVLDPDEAESHDAAGHGARD